MKTNKIFVILFLILSIVVKSQNKETGKIFIETLLVEKNYSKAYTFFDDALKAKLSESLLKETVEKLEKQLGKFKSIIETNNEKEVYTYYSEFENIKMDIKISFKENQKINGFLITPHKEPKIEYAIGKDLSIKSDNLTLQGTILIPEKDNKKKLVIFIHGSGAPDRDETVYENRPFKDIAESLYAKGIASYRFDKRTFSYPESFNDKSTINDEVTNDIINIISYFKNNKEFTDYEIIVLGHSWGANLLPRIANKSNQISQIILLAGNARPLCELLIEQYEYLYKLTPTEELKQAKDRVKEQIAYLNSKSFNLQSPKDKLPLDTSANYWKSVLDYNPTKEIKKVKIPILILQGERDYQVTMKDFEIWKQTLKNNKKATFISYPKLNHMFMTGDSPSDPKEYTVKGTVDANVINDIENFISKK